MARVPCRQAHFLIILSLQSHTNHHFRHVSSLSNAESPPSMAPSSLPPEIILKIISYALPPVLTSNYERSRRLEILRSFSLISRPCRIVSQAELFKSPWLRTPSSAKLFLAPPGLGLRIEGGAQEWVGALSSRGLEFGVASYENWRGEDNRREEWKEWNGLIKTITGMGEEVGPSLVALRLNRMDGIDLFLIVNSLQSKPNSSLPSRLP